MSLANILHIQNIVYASEINPRLEGQNTRHHSKSKIS